MEKASMGTAVGHGSVDPKNFIEKDKNKRLARKMACQKYKIFSYSKGKRVNIPAPGRSSEETRSFFRKRKWSFLVKTVTSSLSRRRWPWARKEFSLLVKGPPPWNGIIPRKGGSR